MKYLDKLEVKYYKDISVQSSKDIEKNIPQLACDTKSFGALKRALGAHVIVVENGVTYRACERTFEAAFLNIQQKRKK